MDLHFTVRDPRCFYRRRDLFLFLTVECVHSTVNPWRTINWGILLKQSRCVLSRTDATYDRQMAENTGFWHLRRVDTELHRSYLSVLKTQHLAKPNQPTQKSAQIKAPESQLSE